MSLYPEFDNISLQNLISYWMSSPIDENDADGTINYIEISLRILEKGEMGESFLFGEFERVKSDDTPRLRAIICSISHPDHNLPGAHDLLLSCLHDERPSVIAESIQGLVYVGGKDDLPEVLSLYSHPDPYVRSSILRYLSRHAPDIAIPMLISALNNSHFILRESAIDELDNLEFVKALEQIRPLINDPHPDVRMAANTAVRNLVELDLNTTK